MKDSRAFTMVEICIVLLISSLVLTGIMKLVTSAGQEVKRGTDIMRTQALVEKIVANLRSDVRSLRNPISIEDDELKIEVFKDGNSRTVEYIFEEGVLSRTGPEGRKKLNNSGEIIALHFSPQPDAKNFQYLEMALRVVSNEPGGDGRIAGKKMSIISHFFPYCKEKVPMFGKK